MVEGSSSLHLLGPIQLWPDSSAVSVPALSLCRCASRRRGGGDMGKKNSGASTPARASNQAVSIREETSGRTRVDEASLLRVKHLQQLASWAGAEAGVGPVGALLGRRLAASAKAAGVPLGAATFLCQR